VLKSQDKLNTHAENTEIDEGEYITERNEKSALSPSQVQDDKSIIKEDQGLEPENHRGSNMFGEGTNSEENVNLAHRMSHNIQFGSS
jgi:hypothetical protein